MKYETMNDVLYWLQVPCNETDTLSKQIGVKLFRLNEQNYEKVCSIVASQCWMPIETMRGSLTDEQIYGGSFLMFSSRNKIQKVSHGWDDEEEKTGIVWVYADGIQMINPTHWMFMPQPPKREK